MAKRPLGHHFFLFFFFIFSLAAACAQERAGQTPALYKLETEKAVMYFFGSIHVGTADMFPLNEKIQKAFAESDNLVVEVNILNESASEMISLFRKMLMYGKGESLDNQLSSQEREKLIHIMKDFGLPYQTYKMFKPVVIDTLLTDKMAQSLGYKPENGIDLYFLNAAGKAGKMIIELESLEEQIAAIGSIPDDAQLLMLLGTVNQQEESAQELEALVEA
jgi:uncharacterized protein YbaP (TraB family)